MSTALVPRNGPVDLPSQEVAHAIAGTLEQLKAVRTFIKAEFDIGTKDRPGIDAGLIPGCGDKPTLFLPGAQKAAMYFNCFPTYKVREKDLDGGHVEYRVRCLLISRGSREQAGEGIGSCSTMETKYRYRKAERVCPTCGVAAIIQGKEEYGGGWVCFKKKGGCGAKFAEHVKSITSQPVGMIENQDLYDIHNTVLKMAKKRALVDAAITLACLSEFFTQDIEDTYRPADVREAAQPYVDASEVPNEPPAPKQKHPDQGGPGKTGSYASEDHDAALKKMIAEAGSQLKRDWEDAWMNANGGDMPPGLCDKDGTIAPFRFTQIVRDLFDWAIEKGELKPVETTTDPETGETVWRASYDEIRKMVAIVFARDHAGVRRQAGLLMHRRAMNVAVDFVNANGGLNLPDDFDPEFNQLEDGPRPENESQEAPEPLPTTPAPKKLSKKELGDKSRFLLEAKSSPQCPPDAAGLRAWLSDQVERDGNAIIDHLKAWAMAQRLPALDALNPVQVANAYAEASWWLHSRQPSETTP